MHRGRAFPLSRFGAVVAAIVVTSALTACGISRPTPGPGQIVAVGAENTYADVISQIGGRYVRVAAIISNPNTDPHSFEASPSVAATIAEAKLVVENGLGYDGFVARITAATPDPSRRVIDVGHLLGLGASTPNPHVWYAPATMPRVAAAIASNLGRLLPRHRGYFVANLRRFDHSLTPWLSALARFRAAHPGIAVASSEPVGDDLLNAAGMHNLTPFSLQADIMNGTDPAPQAVANEDRLLSGRRVRVFVENDQVSDSVTNGFSRLAIADGIPIVGVYETMPAHMTYQRWMRAELSALTGAVLAHRSTTRLP